MTCSKTTGDDAVSEELPPDAVELTDCAADVPYQPNAKSDGPNQYTCLMPPPSCCVHALEVFWRLGRFLPRRITQVNIHYCASEYLFVPDGNALQAREHRKQQLVASGIFTLNLMTIDIPYRNAQPAADKEGAE
jgi:hypothetical protein